MLNKDSIWLFDVRRLGVINFVSWDITNAKDFTIFYTGFTNMSFTSTDVQTVCKQHRTQRFT